MRPLIFYDVKYYYEIALNGYTYDMIHAFQPGFPLLIKLITGFTKMSLQKFVIAAFGINWILGISTIFYLGKMLGNLTTNPFLIRLTLMIFIFNPVSIYYIAGYSESLFMFIQTLGAYMITERIKKKSFDLLSAVKISAVFSLGALVRSNGFLSVFFLIYFYLIYNHKWTVMSTIKEGMISMGLLVMNLTPFVLYVKFSEHIICKLNND